MVKIKTLWQACLLSSAVISTSFLMGAIAQATDLDSEQLLAQVPTNSDEANLLEDVIRYGNEGQSQEALDQVTSVSQLTDIDPFWYEAVEKMVDKYGCIVGYPDSTFKGQRNITRYEFAAALSRCMEYIETNIGTGNLEDGDLATLRRLVQEFEAELATLGARVDDLEGRVAFVEDNQFSTTSKLVGQVVFGLGSLFSGDNVDADTPGTEANEATVFGHRTRLELETSFTGEDLLFTRLATGTFPEFAQVTGTSEGDVSFAQDEGSDVAVEVLKYSFPVGDNTEVVALAFGGASDDFASTVNFLDGDGAEGSISVFGTRNPIYYPFGGAGLGVTTRLGDVAEVSFGYAAANAEDPTAGNGLFDGAYTAIGQVVFQPIEGLNLGLTYLHGYNSLDTGAGSRLANFANFSTALDLSVPTYHNSYGAELSWQLSDKFVLGGWAGYTNAGTLDTNTRALTRGNLDIWNWAVTLGFPDLGKEGSLGGIVVGMEPRVTDSNIVLSGGDSSEDQDTGLHIEAFYQYQVSDNISITPGVIWLTAPDHNNNNEDQIIGTIRTTFSF
ncbi:MAG: iron uptake porin [Spirulinaceae cyanobacterium]